MKKIARIVSQGETINITKADGSTMQKCVVVMRELGGQYGDTFAANAFGQLAQWQFKPNEVYAVALRFAVHEHNGQMYQETILQDCCRIG